MSLGEGVIKVLEEVFSVAAVPHDSAADYLPDARAAAILSTMAPLILRHSTSMSQELLWSAASPSRLSATGR
jgi:hypothetical protein